jgi:hypothetical protein
MNVHDKSHYTLCFLLIGLFLNFRNEHLFSFSFSQYADCSYHKLNFTAATVSGSAALGVVDITVTPANMT